MRVVMIAGCLALSGCVMPKNTNIFDPTARIEPFVTEDGRAGFIAYCGGYYSKISYCYEGARARCMGNYETIRQVEAPRGETGTQDRRLEFVCPA